MDPVTRNSKPDLRQGKSSVWHIKDHMVHYQLPRGMPDVEKGAIFNTGPYGEPA